MESRIVAPGPTPRSVRTKDGEVLEPPDDWALLPPGDAALTRRVKEAGPTWTVQVLVGRKVFSRGVWAPQSTIDRLARYLAAERATPEHAKKRAADQARRQREQVRYMEDFHEEVLGFLAFHPRYRPIAERLARAVTEHATPVGSGTVARTERIPIEERARAAVIAWMRHQTTEYDDMRIARVKGARREVRRGLADRSRELLARYRRGDEIDPERCALWLALIGRRPVQRDPGADEDV